MSPFGPLTALPDLVGRVRAWPVESHQGARRNAIVASSTLAARRAEREDVEEFLGLARADAARAARAGRRTPVTP
jgi:hypothetical protein